MMRRSLLALVLLSAAALHGQEPTVRVEPLDLHGPRPLQSETASAVVRDYLQCWHTLDSAMHANRADMLAPDFVGTAQEKLADTIQQQLAAGISTRYRDVSHDIRIVFYSPDGLSVELVDNVEYDPSILLQDKVLADTKVKASFAVVLTPAEVRWRVRVFQTIPE